MGLTKEIINNPNFKQGLTRGIRIKKYDTKLEIIKELLDLEQNKELMDFIKDLAEQKISHVKF